MYLNPQLAASSRLFEELRNDPPVLERFLVDSSRFVTALADRRDDLAALIGNLNSTTRALGSEKTALAEAIERLPPFMRQANTTYLNLRATLDELDPFVEASKPVARKLRPYLAELRPFAREAVPTVRRLRRLARAPGRDNDLFELQRTYPALADIATVEEEPHDRLRHRREGRGRDPRRVPRAGRGVRGVAPRRSPTAAPTRPTSSAGWTTSRTPAPTTRSAASRARRST